MPRTSRIRRILKLIGVGSSLLIVALWTLTAWYSFFAGWESSSIRVLDGALVFESFRTSGNGPDPFQIVLESTDFTDIASLRLGASRTDYDIVGRIPYSVASFNIPLWLLLLLTAIPTAWLWHRDRRRIRPGCCLRCGYDLTGNTSGVCSECGLAKPPPATV